MGDCFADVHNASRPFFLLLSTSAFTAFMLSVTHLMRRGMLLPMQRPQGRSAPLRGFPLLGRLARPATPRTRGLTTVATGNASGNIVAAAPSRVAAISASAVGAVVLGRHLRTTFKVVGGACTLAAAGLAAAVYLDEGAARTARLVVALVPMLADYQVVRYRVRGLPPQEEQARFAAFHEKWAGLPLRVCLDLRGFYIKIGQVVAGVPDLVPSPDPDIPSLVTLSTETKYSLPNL